MSGLETTTQKSKRRLWLWVGIALAAVALTAAACLLLLSRGGNEPKLFAVQQGKNWGYVDDKGNFAINPQFDEAWPFSDGLALVRVDVRNKPSEKKEKTLADTASTEDVAWTDFSDQVQVDSCSRYGFINAKGEYVIPANYSQASSFSEGIAWVVLPNGAPTAINTKGETLFSLDEAQEAHPFSESLAAFSKEIGGETRWGFVNAKGEVVLAPQFYHVDGFSHGLCAVSNSSRRFDSQWGYINKKIVQDGLTVSGAISTRRANWSLIICSTGPMVSMKRAMLLSTRMTKEA